MIENDSDNNENAVPRTNVRLSNFTFVHRGVSSNSNGAAILLRGGWRRCALQRRSGRGIGPSLPAHQLGHDGADQRHRRGRRADLPLGPVQRLLDAPSSAPTA
ncbi:hypothetical protein AB5I41_29115 [Sphingomonas sp. MMS24-JH45]